MSKIDLEWERGKKEMKNLAKELEKVQNEVEHVETRIKNHFLRSTSSLAS